MTQKYDPDWNPKEYDMTLKYSPMDDSVVNKILNQYKNDDILDYIKQLWKLIDYQKQTIQEHRKYIIANQHKEAWKRYDLSEDKFKVSVDKPPKSGNMSC